jgi:hypothetical protein
VTKETLKEKIDEIPIVQDIVDVFSEKLLGLPHDREI